MYGGCCACRDRLYAEILKKKREMQKVGGGVNTPSRCWGLSFGDGVAPTSAHQESQHTLRNWALRQHGGSRGVVVGVLSIGVLALRPTLWMTQTDPDHHATMPPPQVMKEREAAHLASRSGNHSRQSDRSYDQVRGLHCYRGALACFQPMQVT